MSQRRENEQLKKLVRKFIEPIEDAPYAIIMEIISGHKVIAFDSKSNADKDLLRKMKKALNNATKQIYVEGIRKSRPNEVGNAVEPFVEKSLNDLGLIAEKPTNSRGVKQSSGYPDLIVKDSKGRASYLECKTYNQNTKNSQFRVFYFQVSPTSKIIYPARHLLVAFEMEKEKRRGEEVFVAKEWRLYCLHKLNLRMKHEFNASNKDMYERCDLLATGTKK